MKYLILLLMIAWGWTAGAQAVYVPESGSVMLPLDAAYRLEALARKGAMCDDMIDSTTSLLVDLEGQKIVDYRTILALRNTLLETRQLNQDLQFQLSASEKDKANLKRHLEIARSEATYYQKKRVENVIQWSAGSAAVAIIGTLILVTQLK
jgi:hypothetical protein